MIDRIKSISNWLRYTGLWLPPPVTVGIAVTMYYCYCPIDQILSVSLCVLLLSLVMSLQIWSLNRIAKQNGLTEFPLIPYATDQNPYCDDMPAVVRSLAEKIIAERDRQIDTMSVLAKENILKSTYLMVVNTASNKTLLADTPHFLIAEGELAAIPRLSINVGGKKGSIIIKNGMLPALQMTGEEILSVGKNNMVEQNLFEINSLLAETMRLMKEKGEDISDDFSEFFTENTPKAFIVSNKDRAYGAACLACPEIIGTAIQKMGIDCYILPSSIHDVILIEKNGDFNEIEELRDMVKLINRTEASANEILSDQVFQYNAKTRKIEIARTEQELQAMTQSAPHKSHGMHM